MDKIEVIESFIEGKIHPDQCEDGIFISDDFVAVIDGVTSKTDFTFKGHKPGFLAKNVIGGVIPSLSEQATLEEVITKVNYALEMLNQEIGLTDTPFTERPQAAAAIYSRHFHQVWLIADCAALIDGQVYQNNKLSDVSISAYRSFVLTVRKDQEPNQSLEILDQEIRAEIEPWLYAGSHYANDSDSQYGYSVFNGEPIPLSLIEVIQLNPESREIVLTTDGYPQVFETLELSEAYLNEFLQTDPFGLKNHHLTKGCHPGMKSYDDRAYIRFVSHP